MPPRYAYWTILIDGKATAFRARERDELLPTFNQLARKNGDIVMRYFSKGRLWDSPEQAQWASRIVKRPVEPRGPDWRPGGRHQDPRARFAKRPRDGKRSAWGPERPARDTPRGPRDPVRKVREAKTDLPSARRPPREEKRGWNQAGAPRDGKRATWKPGPPRNTERSSRETTRPPRKKR